MELDTVIDTEERSAEQAATTAPTIGETDLIEDELLVEEISIDGMCGVY